jgi:hypothetical protein
MEKNSQRFVFVTYVLLLTPFSIAAVREPVLTRQRTNVSNCRELKVKRNSHFLYEPMITFFSERCEVRVNAFHHLTIHVVYGRFL